MTRFMFALACMAFMSGSLVACGGSDDDEKDVTPFLGQWQITQGNVNMTCGILGPRMVAIAGVVNITKGTTADLELKLSDPAFADCSLRFNVNKGVAKPLGKQSCMFRLEGAEGTFSVSGGSLALDANTKANLDLSGTAAASALGVPISCQGNVTVDLARAANPTGGNADASSGG